VYWLTDWHAEESQAWAATQRSEEPVSKMSKKSCAGVLKGSACQPSRHPLYIPVLGVGHGSCSAQHRWRLTHPMLTCPE
jgi:hypothetical protein